jgi:molecular chaperone HscC
MLWSSVQSVNVHAMTTPSPVLGIDLGTTYSACAVWQDGMANVLPNVLGEHLTPSVVGLDEDGTVLVGRAARERLISHPQRTVGFFKRAIGSNAEIRLDGPGHQFSPTELSSLVLKSLKADAERILDTEVAHAVISVPAYFNQAQRQATREAGELAGLTVNRLINEPTAAAIAHGLAEKGSRSFIVLDLGGGTFDVSIMEYFDGVLEVHATAGDSALGGEDFNEAILRRFVDEHGLQGMDDPRPRQRLYAQVEGAKRAMSRTEAAELEFCLEGRTYHSTIDDEYVTAAASPLLLRLRGAIERALRDAALEPCGVDDIVLVGGASRLSVFRSLISKLFGRVPRSDVDPDFTVVRGAALQAALVARDEELEDVVLTDVCPFSLGVAVARRRTLEEGLVFCPIIERNTTVPASRMHTFCTLYDNQSAIELKIYQGESRRIENNLRIGHLRLPVPKGPAGEQAIGVRFSYDVSGLLEVDVTVRSTGKQYVAVIENAPGALTPDQKDAGARRLASLKTLPRDLIEVRAATARADRLYTCLLGEQREKLANLIGRFEDVLAGQDPAEVERALVLFNRDLDEFEQDVWG